jgi:hypothetical protein
MIKFIRTGRNECSFSRRKKGAQDKKKKKEDNAREKHLERN